MIKIGITGNIAAGKSEAEKLLSEYKYPVIDTDRITHFLLENSKSVREKIFSSFDGYDFLNESGSIDRQKLGKIVFNNSELLKRLENIIHPEVIDEVLKFFNKNRDEKLVFVSVPLLYEINCAYLFDKVILVYSDDKIREERLIKYRNFSRNDALLRMRSQISQEKKIKSADYVIYNDTDIKSFSVQLNKVIKEILNY